MHPPPYFFRLEALKHYRLSNKQDCTSAIFVKNCLLLPIKRSPLLMTISKRPDAYYGECSILICYLVKFVVNFSASPPICSIQELIACRHSVISLLCLTFATPPQQRSSVERYAEKMLSILFLSRVRF